MHSFDSSVSIRRRCHSNKEVLTRSHDVRSIDQFAILANLSLPASLTTHQFDALLRPLLSDCFAVPLFRDETLAIHAEFEASFDLIAKSKAIFKPDKKWIRSVRQAERGTRGMATVVNILSSAHTFSRNTRIRASLYAQRGRLTPRLCASLPLCPSPSPPSDALQTALGHAGAMHRYYRYLLGRSLQQAYHALAAAPARFVAPCAGIVLGGLGLAVAEVGVPPPFFGAISFTNARLIPSPPPRLPFVVLCATRRSAEERLQEGGGDCQTRLGYHNGRASHPAPSPLGACLVRPWHAAAGELVLRPFRPGAAQDQGRRAEPEWAGACPPLSSPNDLVNRSRKISALHANFESLALLSLHAAAGRRGGHGQHPYVPSLRFWFFETPLAQGCKPRTADFVDPVGVARVMEPALRLAALLQGAHTATGSPLATHYAGVLAGPDRVALLKLLDTPAAPPAAPPPIGSSAPLSAPTTASEADGVRWPGSLQSPFSLSPSPSVPVAHVRPAGARGETDRGPRWRETLLAPITMPWGEGGGRRAGTPRTINESVSPHRGVLSTRLALFVSHTARTQVACRAYFRARP